MRRLISRLGRDTRGVSAMEFALILPLLVMFSAGTIEYSRLILATQKLQSGAFTLADLTARYDDDDMDAELLADIFLAIDQVIQPFDFAARRAGDRDEHRRRRGRRPDRAMAMRRLRRARR